MIDSPVDLHVLESNSSVKSMNCWTTYIGDLFIVVKVKTSLIFFCLSW